ncbi:beta galactosidase jelly roll domain-containing protein [bacterium]|nr:beta galactosidase jelly roll domain-containing protein [bacterium]
MKRIIAVIVWLIAAIPLSAKIDKLEIDLTGTWKFEIGDDSAFADPGFNDSHWGAIQVPAYWEEQGFPGYNGYGWYRIVFKVPRRLKNRSIKLKLGRIDDVDQAYLNGALIGSMGSFPPALEKAYDKERVYPLPAGIVRFGGVNTLAVRVYDEEGGGGIPDGPVGIFSEREVFLELDLSGKWKFKPGDDPARNENGFDDSGWKRISVPGTWEKQGYADMDGYAWYRQTVSIPARLKNSRLLLVLGKIDDMDETFWNGTKIGSTGHMEGAFLEMRNNPFYNRERMYFIPPNLMRWDSENQIAIRVYDIWNHGGIYEGPAGITTQKHFLEYMGKQKIRTGFFERLTGWLKGR